MRGGCFSGSAIEHDGKLFLMYTGTSNRGEGYEQTQCIAYSEDGIHFTKYEGNPVICSQKSVPSDLFRDPKVWKHEGTYYMVCGASRNRRAQALLYRSKDMLQWEFVNVLAESRGEWGYMWECPDFYRLDDKYVLMFSPMGESDRKAVYLVGDFDYNTGKFIWHVSGEIDWGMDYYAPQSFLAPDGRRITAMSFLISISFCLPPFSAEGLSCETFLLGNALFLLIHFIKIQEENHLLSDCFNLSLSRFQSLIHISAAKAGFHNARQHFFYLSPCRYHRSWL